MLGYVYDHPEIIVPFVAALIPDCHGRGLPKASAAIGVVDEAGRLIAGLVYHGYQPEAGTLAPDSTGKFRHIKIKVTRKGLKVRTRSGFYAVASE